MQAVLDLVGDIYEASYNPDHWVVALQKLCTLLGAKSGAIFVEEHERRSRYMLARYGMPRLSEVSYRFGLAKQDYAFKVQLAQPIGEPRQIIDQAAVREGQPVYHRLLRLLDLGYIAGMNLYRDEEWFVGLGLHRGFHAAPFGEHELGLLRLLYPHLKRAVRIHREFMRLRLREQSLSQALSRMAMGVVVLDAGKRISYVNPVAELLLARHGALFQRQGGLQARVASEHTRLQTLIDTAMKADPKSVDRRNLALALHAPEREFPLNVIVTRLGPDDVLAVPAEPGSVALYLTDPEAAVNIPADALRSLYGMTEAEASVAIMLANGLSLREISEINEVSVETVRSQLKSVFHRMGVSKQQDVVRILLGSALAAGA